MDKHQKVQRNLILGFVSQLLTIALGIVLPRLTLTSYGSEVNGLVNSIANIYAYIALLEVGVGGAAVQAMYRTIGNESRDDTNAILAATNIYYHRTGVLYLIAITVFSIVYPLVVKTGIPTVTIVLVIIVNGLGSVVRFWFQGKYFLLLQAEGKNYVQIAMNMFITVFSNIAKIALMSLGMDVVIVQAIGLFCSLFSMIYISWYIKKNYAWIDLSVKPDFKAISQSKNVLVHQINQLVFNNTDAITLTLFAGLKMVSVYTMYTLIYGMVQTALGTVINGVLFVMGQTYHTSRERFKELYDCYETYYMTFAFWLYAIANFFILPFIKLYTSGVNDIEYVNPYLPHMFVATFLLSTSRNAASQAINIAGHFKQTQGRATFESIINVIISVIAVQVLGIYGVLIGTMAALFYRANDMILYANHKIMNRSAWPSYRRWIVDVAVFVVLQFVNTRIHLDLSTYPKIIVWCIPYAVVTFIFFFGASSVFDSIAAKNTLSIIKSRFHRRTV